MELVVKATPRPLYPQERPGTHCIGGWLSPMSGLDGRGKFRPHRYSIPGNSSPWLVAIPNETLGFWWGDLTETAHLEDLGVDGWI
jgi:hypothetical protein